MAAAHKELEVQREEGARLHSLVSSCMLLVSWPVNDLDPIPPDPYILSRSGESKPSGIP